MTFLTEWKERNEKRRGTMDGNTESAAEREMKTEKREEKWRKWRKGMSLCVCVCVCVCVVSKKGKKRTTRKRTHM